MRRADSNGGVELAGSLARALRSSLLVFLFVTGCSNEGGPEPDPTPTPPVLSISTSPRLLPPPTPQDSLDALDLAAGAGARGNLVTFTWRALEPETKALDLRPLLRAVERLGAGRDLDLLLDLRVIDGTVKAVPEDLAVEAFDSPEMIDRFDALLDELLPELDRHARYLSIGHAVDIYLFSHPSEWAAYRTFYEAVAAKVRIVAPWIEIGVTATYAGAIGAASSQMAALNTTSDVLILTYYPLRSDYVTRGPNALASDFPQMLAIAAVRPLILQEVGYPSAALLESSEEEQAAFVTNLFEMWESSVERIPFLNVHLLHDWTPEICHSLAVYYGLPDDENYEVFLCSVGLWTQDGTPKPAWQSLLAGATKMGLRD